MPYRVIIKIELAGMFLAEDWLTASSVIQFSAVRMRPNFMSLGDTHGMLPFVQKALLALEGVPPPDQVPSSPKLCHRQ
jgi:hypothetical protein